MKEIKIIPDEIGMSFFFVAKEPIPEDELVELLKTRAYEEITETPKFIGSPDFGIERQNIVRKGKCQILYDLTQGMIGVVGKNYDEILERFEEM